MLELIQQFAAWLSVTQASLFVANTAWIIPAVQSVHIVCIAIVFSTALMINFRALGWAGHSQSLSSFTTQFMPWIWISLVVLLLTGMVLTIGEPARELLSPAFWTKMGLIVVAAIIAYIFQKTLQRDSQFWEVSAERRAMAKGLALLSIVIWICIVAAGRLIAYLGMFEGTA